jgi:flagellin
MNSVNTNVGAMIALQSLNATNTELFTVQSRVNTGRKINNAKDNAAVWAIAQNQRGEVASYNAVKESLQRGQSAIDVGLSAGESVSDLLNKMKQLALSASDKNLDASSRKAMETEYNSLAKQIGGTVGNASFNGVNLLDGSTVQYKALANSKGTASIDVNGENLTLRTTAARAASAVTSTVDITSGLAVAANGPVVSFTVDADGAGANVATTISFASGTTWTADQIVEQVNNTLKAATGGSALNARVTAELVAGTAAGTKVLKFNSTYTGTASSIVVTAAAGLTSAGMTSTTAGAAAVGGGGVLEVQGNVTFDANTNFALLIQQLDTSIQNVSSSVGRLGSGSKAMEGTLNFVSRLQDTLESGIGNLVDADLAKESARLQALQTKQQLGVQALSIANQSTSILLSLFRQ